MSRDTPPISPREEDDSSIADSSSVSSFSSVFPLDPDAQDTSLLERFLFHASWVGATFGGCVIDKRDPHNEIYQNRTTDVSLTLGSILLDNVRDIKLTKQLRRFTLQSFAKTHSGRPLFVIQVLKDFELTTPLFGTGLTAIAPDRNSTDNISVQVRRLMLVDFSSDMRPTEEFLNEFNKVYSELKDQTSADIYVHCKAGVNRSFRVAAALYVLFELSLQPEESSFAAIVDKVADICVTIREKRSYIDLHPDNCIKQLSFIAHLVLKGRNMTNEVNDGTMKKRVLSSVRTVLLPGLLKKYIRNRENDSKHTSFLGGLFKSAGCSKLIKLAAAQKFLDDLIGDKEVSYSSDELDALADGRLKNLVLWTQKTIGLPEKYTQDLKTKHDELARRALHRLHK